MKVSNPDGELVAKLEDLVTADFGPPDACWVWVFGRSDSGYGRVWHNGRKTPVHRLAYERLVGPIPEGLQLDHLCRVRACFNPAHLEPVTSAENTLRGAGPTAVNAAKTHCPQGHSYAVHGSVHSDGYRHCRPCAAVHSRNYRARPADESGKPYSDRRADYEGGQK